MLRPPRWTVFAAVCAITTATACSSTIDPPHDPMADVDTYCRLLVQCGAPAEPDALSQCQTDNAGWLIPATCVPWARAQTCAVLEAGSTECFPLCTGSGCGADGTTATECDVVFDSVAHGRTFNCVDACAAQTMTQRGICASSSNGAGCVCD